MEVFIGKIICKWGHSVSIYGVSWSAATKGTKISMHPSALDEGIAPAATQNLSFCPPKQCFATEKSQNDVSGIGSTMRANPLFL